MLLWRVGFVNSNPVVDATFGLLVGRVDRGSWRQTELDPAWWGLVCRTVWTVTQCPTVPGRPGNGRLDL